MRAYLAFMWAHPGKQLLFMGSEIAQYAEWSESRGLDWWLLDNADHRGVQHVPRRPQPGLPGHARAVEPRQRARAASSGSTPTTPPGNSFSWLRWGHDGAVLACVVNFSGGPHEGYRVGLPYGGTWNEVVNTDAEAYGGSGVGNLGAVARRGGPLARPALLRSRPRAPARRALAPPCLMRLAAPTESSKPRSFVILVVPFGRCDHSRLGPRACGWAGVVLAWFSGSWSWGLVLGSGECVESSVAGGDEVGPWPVAGQA